SIVIETDVPARLDRLPWSRFHSLVIVALGITWILDGLEVTIAGSIVGALEESPVLHFTPQQIGLVATAYLAGAVVGALRFGYLTDRFGRRKLFFVTLALYLTATAATALSWDFWSFALFRVLTGAGIGGEYAAINSAIQELIPARYRGRTDLAVNGSFWVGAALGALGAVVLLQPGLLPPDWGWRAAFGIGAVLGLGILFLRQWIPESPRWLMLHARTEECEAVLCGIEERVLARPGAKPLAEAGVGLRLFAASHTPILRMIRAILRDYPRRAVLGLVLMASQAFFYNAIFFSFASAAASAAYLTVSESFPLEARALAIAFFYAVGTGIGGVASPWLFGMLVGSGDRGDVFLGYLFGALLMVGAAIVELLIGVKAERQPLESVARPISALE